MKRLLLRFFGREFSALHERIEILESRTHHLEVTTRDLIARLSTVENDLSWLINPNDQPLPPASELPPGVTFHHKK
jgi:hypothetical protein